jgi:hypothetical protein
MSVMEDPEPLAPTNITIALEVHDGMTKTVHRIKENGELKFRNKSKQNILTITSDNKPAPFMVEGLKDPQSTFTVPADDKVTVRVASEYVFGTRFTYKAQIDGSEAEDPIVIVDH